MTPEEKAAEEEAQKFMNLCQAIDRELTLSPDSPAAIEASQYKASFAKKCFVAGFRTGHAHALTPRKIILGQPDTYPPFNTLVIVINWEVLDVDIVCIEGENHLRVLFRDDYAHYLPLPPTPQREGEG